jgi:hypothetical protein
MQSSTQTLHSPLRAAADCILNLCGLRPHESHRNERLWAARATLLWRVGIMLLVFPAIPATPIICGSSLAAQSFPAIYAFGSDMTATRGGPYAQGRWCNGPVWVEHLSARFGIPYNPDHNRAEGGANSVRILNQVIALPAPNNGRTALFVMEPAILDLGSNAASATNVSYWQMLVNQLMATTAAALERLHLKGARTVVLVNAPDLAKFPQIAALDPATRSALRTRIQEHNFALLLEAQKARNAFPGLDVRVTDLFRFFDVVHARALDFGFTKTDIAAWHDDDLPDKSFNGPGSHYLFWDNVQPSSAFHALMTQGIEADLTSTRVELIWHSTSPILSVRNLRLGRSYCLERSVDLQHWVEWDFFESVDFSWSVPVAEADGPSSFFRALLLP